MIKILLVVYIISFIGMIKKIEDKPDRLSVNIQLLLCFICSLIPPICVWLSITGIKELLGN